MAHKATAVEATARGVMPAEGAAMDPAKRAELRQAFWGCSASLCRGWRASWNGEITPRDSNGCAARATPLPLEHSALRAELPSTVFVLH